MPSLPMMPTPMCPALVSIAVVSRQYSHSKQ
jgi:hypothetical protein